MYNGLHKQQCTSLGTFSKALYALNRRGFVNVCHHTPSALGPNEYFICTQQGCSICNNNTGLSVVWRESDSISARAS